MPGVTTFRRTSTSASPPSNGRVLRSVRKPHKDGRAVNRRAFEVCVFIHLANALQAGDLHVIGSEAFADDRDQLLAWPDCQERLAGYCAALGMPGTGDGFVALLKAQLTTAANAVDEGFPENTELTLDADGVPHRKRQPATEAPDGLAAFEQEIRIRMPERHLLDILKSTEHWSRYTRHFGPPSGSDPKLSRAVQRYLLTVFGYRCNLGPNQTARHRHLAEVAPDQRPAHRRRQAGSRDGRRDRGVLALLPAKILGHGEGGDRRRHPCPAAREQPPRLPAHPPRRVWRHRLPPHRRQRHRAVHQLHRLWGLGSCPHPGRPSEEPLAHPAGHAARRHAWPERNRLRPQPPAGNHADAADAYLVRRGVLPSYQDGQVRPHRPALQRRHRLEPDRDPLAGHHAGRHLDPGRPGPAVDAAPQARHAQPEKPSLPGFPGAWPGRANPVPVALRT